jgi:hypothetical protein
MRWHSDPLPAGKNRRQTETDAFLASTVAFFASTATGGPDADPASVSCRHDDRGNCLNLKGVIAIKLVAAPRYQSRYLLSIPVSASAAPRGNLDSAKVHQIRTSGLTDSHHCRLFRVSVATVRDARIGKTWTDHPTPPDMAPRNGGVRNCGREAKRRDGSA